MALAERPLLPDASAAARLAALLQAIPRAYWVIGAILLLMPLVANSFFLFQVFGWAFILGMIALSLMFLAGYGGMVSLAQMSIAALAGYMVAILGGSGVEKISLLWPWWLYVPVAIIVAATFATLVGALAVRTEGIYTIMITLAFAAAFFYFTRQNYTIFNEIGRASCRERVAISVVAGSSNVKRAEDAQ